MDVVAGVEDLVALTRFHLFSGSVDAGTGDEYSAICGDIDGVVSAGVEGGGTYDVTGAERKRSPAGPSLSVALTNGRHSLPTTNRFLSGAEAEVDNVLGALDGALEELRLTLLTAAAEGRISDGLDVGPDVMETNSL